MYNGHADLNQMSKQSANNSFKEVVDSGMFPVVVTCNATHTVLYINLAAEEFFSLDVGQAVGEKAVDYWANPTERKRYIEQIQTKGKIRNFETELQLGNGEKRCVLLSGKLISFNGKAAVSTIFQDITSQKIAELELKQSEERYHELYNMVQLLTDNMPDLLWAKDLEKRYIFTNKANREKLLKCPSPDEPIGKPHSYFVEREREKGQIYTFGEVCEDSDAIVTESVKPGRFLEQGQVGDDHLILDVHKAPMFNPEGKLIGTVGAGRDITQETRQQEAKRASDERYRLLAENVRDVIWTMDNTFRFTYVTPSILNLLGHSPEEFLASRLRIHLARSSLETYIQFRNHYSSLLRDNICHDEQQFWELELKKKDGSLIWVDTITSPILDENNRMLGIIGVTRDVTAKVEAQTALSRAKNDALSASRAKSEFLANMSHEIRTPMNGILGMLQLLKSSRLDENQAHYVKTALQSGTSLLHLLSDILDFSKIEAGKIELSHEKFSLLPFLTGVLQPFESMIDPEQITLNFLSAGNLPCYVCADKFRLQQILVNLIGNSVKFTRTGRIDLRVRALSPGKGKTTLKFSIEDTGIGIPDHRRKHLFEPFVQADGSFQRKYAGTGLGLSIVKRLVTLMGGEVTIDSQPGFGTVVEFDIPVDICESVGCETEHSNLACSEISPASILVVEDEKINGMVVSAMLQNMGHTVTLVENGRQALDTLGSQEFDCILMDIQMPEMDGIETAKHIRRQKGSEAPLPPIIAVTAHAMKGDRELFLEAGMDDYLTKPIDAQELQQTLAKALGHRSSP